MNIKDEHTSRLWTFILKGENMAFDLDESELIATRVNNKAASWKEVEEYIEKYYLKKDKVKELQDKYKNKIEKLESKKIWNEPVDTIYKNRYTNYFNAYEELLQEGE